MGQLNIDVQNVFVQIAADAPSVVERINRLAEVCRVPASRSSTSGTRCPPAPT